MFKAMKDAPILVDAVWDPVKGGYVPVGSSITGLGGVEEFSKMAFRNAVRAIAIESGNKTPAITVRYIGVAVTTPRLQAA